MARRHDEPSQEEDWVEDDGAQHWGAEEDWEADDGFYDEVLDKEERRQARRDRMRVASGVVDFFGVIAGTVCILVLIALLVSLLNWLNADVTQYLTLFSSNL